MITEKIVIPESIHAYTATGEPVPEVPRKNPLREGQCPNCETWISTTAKGKTKCKKCETKVDVSGWYVNGLRETTTKDMKEYGLFPSISRLCSYGEMPIELSNWYKTRLVKHVMACYDLDPAKWMLRVNQGLSALENEYSDRGTQIHAWIQQFMEGQPAKDMDATGIRCCREIKEWEQSLGITGATREYSHCDPDYCMAGTIDFASTSPRVIADYKTKHSKDTFEAIKKGNRSPLWGVIKQLAGYIWISGGPHPSLRAFAVFVRVEDDHPETGETLPVEITNDELKDGFEAIKANTTAWLRNKRFNLHEMYKSGECWTLNEILSGERE